MCRSPLTTVHAFNFIHESIRLQSRENAVSSSDAAILSSPGTGTGSPVSASVTFSTVHDECEPAGVPASLTVNFRSYSRDAIPTDTPHAELPMRVRFPEPRRARKTQFNSRRILWRQSARTQTHYRCSVCGAKWLHISESGVGGHGSSWSREDDEQ